MPRVVFEGNLLGREKSVDVEAETPLVDLADLVLAPIPFSCRSATCATCQVDVVAGAELLLPAGDEERELLALLRCPPTTRLACQAVVQSGFGTLRVKPAGT
ncbi:MAG: 2Fe-2S iron-sulfur cluster binding domain-containing protein [Polyangiaceae bacterium]|nr:2Fe-2S iron-sulfur cluster binding domain-containing protein [Polyangiaceae bacterium]